ncbi:MAG: Dabb family protein [Candidatus Omnitrophica bacterium]|nr:Dabb family protein [Candidatus Omnitrophota bacterium]
MLKHVLMWKVKAECNGKKKPELIDELAAKLESLIEISEVVSLKVGKNVSDRKNAFDIVFFSEFKSNDDLQSYRDNPYHLEVADYINSVTEMGFVVDYYSD